jgi:hypothetical protein
VVLHLKYTARDGGDILRNAATKAVQATIEDADNTPLARMFSLKHEFPTEWYHFLHPVDAATPKLDLTQERFPFQFRGKTITIHQMKLFLKIKDEFVYDDKKQALVFHFLPESSPSPLSFVRDGSPIKDLPCADPKIADMPVPSYPNLLVQEDELPKGVSSKTTWWQKLDGTNHTRLKPDAIEDIWLVCYYSVQDQRP